MLLKKAYMVSGLFDYFVIRTYGVMIVNYLKKCPKCGSKAGFIVAEIVHKEELIGFDGQVKSVDGQIKKELRNVTCSNCKKCIAKTSQLLYGEKDEDGIFIITV